MGSKYFDVIDIIRDDTEEKAPGIYDPFAMETNSASLGEEISPKKPDIDDSDSLKEPVKGSLVKPKHRIDSDLTTEIAINTIDTAQFMLLFKLNNRKIRKRMFQDKQEFSSARDLIYQKDEILKKKDPAELILLKKIEQYNKKLETLGKQLPFSNAEKNRAAAPLRSWVETKNFDIPPGLALLLVGLDLFTNRVMTLMDD